MRGIIGIASSSSACVRFIRDRDVDDEDGGELVLAESRNVLIISMDATTIASSEGGTIFDLLGKTIVSANYPYGNNKRIELLDDS